MAFTSKLHVVGVTTEPLMQLGDAKSSIRRLLGRVHDCSSPALETISHVSRPSHPSLCLKTNYILFHSKYIFETVLSSPSRPCRPPRLLAVQPCFQDTDFFLQMHIVYSAHGVLWTLGFVHAIIALLTIILSSSSLLGFHTRDF